jgi:hypothetical protein
LHTVVEARRSPFRPLSPVLLTVARTRKLSVHCPKLNPSPLPPR